MDETESILSSVKKLLDIVDDETEFDSDVQSGINSAFLTLYRLGIGPSDPFRVDDMTTWEQLDTIIPKDVILDYLHLKVALVFDPPASSAVIEVYNNRISELEFTMNIMVDNGGGNVTG